MPTLTLDRLLDTFAAPDFVKIDIEGAELLALLGAARLINEVRPVFYIEVGESVAAEVFDLFQKAEYVAFDEAGEQLTRCVTNTFFKPS